jgi:membrane-bound metal-dependent hydrolase YbcI (DUF457 family)
MADFKTHLAFSSLLGVGYGAGAYAFYHVPVPTCILAGGLCSVSGMLPDVDSDAGRPLRESMAFAAAIVSVMMVDRLKQFGLSPETIVLATAGIYLLIRFGLAEFMRRYTVHRGMFHSLPAAVIMAEIAFLLVPGGDVQLRIYQAGAVLIGYLSHLLLDEVYSLQWYHGHLRFKQSFGTAIKVFGHGWWANISTFAKLAILSYVVLKEPGWMEQHYRQDIEPSIRQAAHQAINQVMR